MHKALSSISATTFSRPTTYAQPNNCSRESWGSDQGPQCSKSSHGKEPQLKVLWVVLLQVPIKSEASTSHHLLPVLYNKNSCQRAAEMAQWVKAFVTKTC